MRRHPALCAAFAFGLMAGAAAPVSAQAPGAAGNPGTASLVPPADAPPVVTAPSGPYRIVTEANPSLKTHTIYRPASLARFTGSRRLPIIAWGNGACSNAGLLFQNFLGNIASNGFVIIVSGPKDAPLPAFATAKGAAPLPRAAGVEVPPPPMTKDGDMQTAINWAIAENDRKGSVYFHKLNPDKIAVMGQSCGGLQAIANSGDPRVKTSIIWNSGTFPDGGIGAKISGATKESLSKFHAPVAYIAGGPHDAAFVNAIDDIKHIDGVPVFFGWINSGHGGTYNHPGGGRFEPVGVAWLKWRLNGDKAAAKLFEGPDCGLCRDPVWHVSKKGMN